MTRDVVIRAEDLGKKYVIGHQVERESYVALRDVLARNARNLARSAKDLFSGRPNVVGDKLEDFWALQNVSFEIGRGEIVGVVGRNGAGKSTLLKVLSRITEPTTGRVAIKGRVASLLEVGTGFHPELTGRENIFLNGAILGMTGAEIRRKFDEIVDFAEVERFLDTPVKRYSSGMYVRLAFAVAAHLEPEILIIDEVLAVGDVEFQKKCLGKMSEVAGHGRTVLFVSHNMAAVRALCTRAISFDAGRVILDADVSKTIEHYLRVAREKTRSDAIKIQDGVFLQETRVDPTEVETGHSVSIEMDFLAEQPTVIEQLEVQIYSETGTRLALADARECGQAPYVLGRGEHCLALKIPSLPLVEGNYSVNLFVRTKHAYQDITDAAHFSVTRDVASLEFAPISAERRGVFELSSLGAEFQASAKNRVEQKAS